MWKICGKGGKQSAANSKGCRSCAKSTKKEAKAANKACLKSGKCPAGAKTPGVPSKKKPVKKPKMPQSPNPPRPKAADGGKILLSDIDRIRSEGEKSAQFEATYKKFMDALDDVCYHEMPPEFTPTCAPLYKYGDRVVEMYLHGYDDWELCSELTVTCPHRFFIDESVRPHRI